MTWWRVGSRAATAARSATVLPAPTSPVTTPRADSTTQKLIRAIASACAARPDRSFAGMDLPNGVRVRPKCAAHAAALTPALLGRTMTLWSKVFRRPFITGLGVAMPPGIHEDVPLSATALLKAGRIALLDRVCYLYRRRSGSFLATASMGHFGIFPSYARVFAALADGPAPAVAAPAVRAAVFARMIEHYSSILANGLVPRRARREFFGRMAADFRRYRPPGYRR